MDGKDGGQILVISLYTPDPNFGSLSWFWRCKEPPCPLSPHAEFWNMLEVPELGSASGSWFGYGHWSLIHPYAEFWLSILVLKVQKTSMSTESSFGTLDIAEGSWLGSAILNLIWIWSLAFDSPMFQIFSLYLDFKAAKKIHVILFIGGHCRFLSGVWHLDLGLNMVTSLWYNHDSNFGSILILKVQRTSMSFKSLF